MEITNSFTVDAPIDEAWELLTNIAEIAPCLPGAKLTDETDGVYTGGVKIKVGPVTAEYKGSAEFVEKDETTHKAVIKGKGRDTRGAGNAQALITAQMIAVGDKTQVDIVTDLKVSGKVAQFGRGVMQDVSTKLLGQFAECLEEKIAEPETVDAIAAAGAADAAASAPAHAASTDATSDAVSASPAHAADAAETAPQDSAPAAPAQEKKVDASKGDDDDDVLDLSDIGLGSVLAKRYGPAVGGVAAFALLIWLIRKLRS